MGEPAMFSATREYASTSFTQIWGVFLLPAFEPLDPSPLLSPRPHFGEILRDLIQLLTSEGLGMSAEFVEYSLFDVFNTALDFDIIPSGMNRFQESLLTVTNNHRNIIRD